MARRSHPRRLLLLLLAALAPACGEGDRAPAASATVEVPVVLRPLWAEEASLEVLRESDEDPVRPAMLVPLGRSWFDAGALPGLRMAPPAEVRVDLGPTPDDAHLALALGLHRDAYGPGVRGRVEYEVLLDGEPVHVGTRPAGEDVPRLERAWERLELDLDGARELVLRTRRLPAAGEADPGAAGEDPPAPIPAGFGLLQVRSMERVPRAPRGPGRPNLVLVVIDTLRADALGGTAPARVGEEWVERPRSPHMDDLARRGTAFERAFSTSSWTWPATASLMTGLLPEEHGFVGADSCYLSDELWTMAEVLQLEGWTTAAFVANPIVSRTKNLDQGFGEFHEYEWASTRTFEHQVHAWLEEHADERFHLYLHLVDPHVPLDPDPDQLEAWVPEDLREAELESLRLHAMLGRRARGLRFDEALLARHEARLRALYAAEVASVDRAVGNLLARLEELGLLEDTLVALTSDHGEEFLDHGQIGHGAQLFDETVRVPLILAGPGVTPGAVEGRAVESRHLAPALLRLAGVAPRGNLRTSADLFAPEPGPLWTSTSTGVWFSPEDGRPRSGPLFGLRLGDELLHHVPRDVDGGPGWTRYYDLATDPDAHVDLADEHPERVDELLALQRRHLEQALARRPTTVGGGAAVRDELEALGYGGADDED